jgi:release factor glutamine methyltransferase
MELSRPTTVRAAIDAAARALRSASTTPLADAEILLRHVMGLTRVDVLVDPGRPLSDVQCAQYAALVERRERGEPVSYLTGRREFWSLELAVSPATLIPRPETELLVERAAARIGANTASIVADLGTGCGAVALAIAHERPRTRIIAIDCSASALAVARDNAQRLGLANVEFRLGDWLTAAPDVRFDVIVSNPPYVRAGDPHLEQGDLRFEPPTALVAGGDALDAIRRIIGMARAYLTSAGWLLLEHGFDQAPDVRAVLARFGFQEIRTYNDVSGHERVTEGRFPV